MTLTAREGHAGEVGTTAAEMVVLRNKGCMSFGSGLRVHSNEIAISIVARLAGEEKRLDHSNFKIREAENENERQTHPEENSFAHPQSVHPFVVWVYSTITCRRVAISLFHLIQRGPSDRQLQTP